MFKEFFILFLGFSALLHKMNDSSQIRTVDEFRTLMYKVIKKFF